MGKLFVLDGLDGCGKSTQLERINIELKKCNAPYKQISFPDYDQPSSALVQQYLAGEYGEHIGDVSAYAASSFYAVDRYASYKKFWESDYKDGKLIVAARYTTSNAIYQTTQLPKEQWDHFLEWLEDYEYNKLGLPKPDMVCFLDMPQEVSQKLLLERYHGDESKKDVHERDVDFLNKCRETALYAANKFGWKVIPCSQDGNPISMEKITSELMKNIKEFL